jgi:hypothetical protein
MLDVPAVPDVSEPLAPTVDMVDDVSVALVVVVDVSVVATLLLLVSWWQAKAITASAQTSARIHG